MIKNDLDCNKRGGEEGCRAHIINLPLTIKTLEQPWLLTTWRTCPSSVAEGAHGLGRLLPLLWWKLDAE